MMLVPWEQHPYGDQCNQQRENERLQALYTARPGYSTGNKWQSTVERNISQVV